MRVYISEGAKFEAPRPGDVGYDLRSTVDYVIGAGETVKIPTGIYLEIPDGLFGKVFDRSGKASEGLIVGAGVIDPSYRGEIRIVVHNFSGERYIIHRGDKIAQIVFIPYVAPQVEEVGLDVLTKTERGEAGFGSTDVG